MDLRNIISSLNSLARTGWMLRGIPPSIAETVSQHVFAASLIALFISEKMRDKYNIDIGKTVSMTLVHDIVEAFTGDIVAPISDEYFKEMREIMEKDVLEKKISSQIIKELYTEFLEQKTIEAKVARLSDYIATYLQGLYYSSLGYNVNDIISNMKNKIKKYSSELGINDIIEEIMDS